MGINFCSVNSTDSSNERTGINTEGRTVNLLNLKKNDVLDLSKNFGRLERVTVGAGWDVPTRGRTYDLDLAAFLLHDDERVHDPANEVVFFNKMKQRGIQLNGDNRTGEGDGDDEQISINLNKIDPEIQSIVFIVTIFDAEKYHQVFGQVKNAYVRLFNNDDNDEELLRFSLTDDVSANTAVIFARLLRHGDSWDFEGISEGKDGNLNDLLAFYM